MSWIKDNKFLVALAGGTLLGVILLFMVGLNASSRYEKAKEDFDVAFADASTFEKLMPYPIQENRDGKSKALDEYRKAVAELQESFAPFRPGNIENVSPQDFTNRLKAVNDGVLKAFEESNCEVPEGFFCGFENYKTTLAPGNATGILGYQLGGINNLMLALANSGASALKNLHRPLLPEEQGSSYQPQPGEVARRLPLEITFTGSEKSVRGFLSTIVKPDQQYIVIRSLRISNAKKEPPRASDAQFENSAAASEPAAGGGDFGGAFVLPDEEPAADVADESPAAPAAEPADSSRILAQVLGDEELQVFLRLDQLLFLPQKSLP